MWLKNKNDNRTPSLFNVILPTFQIIRYSKNLESQNILSLIKVIEKFTKIYNIK